MRTDPLRQATAAALLWLATLLPEQVAGAPKLVVYNIEIFANGTVQILQQGQPTPPVTLSRPRDSVSPATEACTSEANAAVAQFEALAEGQKQQLMRFLRSL